jgi:hypothetical protein
MPNSVRDQECTLRKRRAGMNEGPRLLTLTASLAGSSEPGLQLSRRQCPNRTSEISAESSVPPNSPVPLAVDLFQNLVLFLILWFRGAE